MTDGEEWRVIPRFPCYAVSTFGRVKRVVEGKTAKAIVGRCLKQNRRGQGGYLGVALRENGKTVSVYVHTIVLMAFVGERPSERHQVAHNNGNPADNRLVNLRWALPSENAADKIAHGTLQIGESHHNAKLTEREIRHIRKRRAAGEYYKDIAADFGISKAYCCLVVQGKRWGHVS
jgi:hypothetical protein